jgi:hypothetical protein
MFNATVAKVLTPTSKARKKIKNYFATLAASASSALKKINVWAIVPMGAARSAVRFYNMAR